MIDFIKDIKMKMLSSAILCVILGIVLVIYPNTSLAFVCRAVGVIVLIAGIGFIYGYFKIGKDFWYGKMELIFGGIFAILGGFIVLNPLRLISIVPIVFGVFLVCHGIADMKQAFELHRYEDRRWWFPVVIAATTIVLGVIIMKNPFESIDMLMRIVGVCLIYVGLMNTVLVGRFVKAIRNFRKMEEEAAEHADDIMKDDVEFIEGEYREL